MNRLRAKSTTFTLTVLRIATGLVMAVHGAQKLADVPGTAHAFASMGFAAPTAMVWLAIAGELLGGLGLLVGALTPIAAFGVLSVMATAIAVVHFPHGLMAKNGGFEYPLVMACVALYFVTRGAGPFSVDALVRKQRGYDSDPEARLIAHEANPARQESPGREAHA